MWGALQWFWLIRPRAAVLIASVPLVGLGYGLWERGSTIAFRHVALRIVLLWVAWLLAHAGSMWLNAVLDRDTGPLLLGRAVQAPRGTAALGYVSLGLAVVVAWFLGSAAFACALICALLAILYSHPRVAWKGHALAGPAVNAIGYGVLSPFAGWWVAGGVLTWRTALALAVVVLCLLSVFFAAQAFQGSEDRARGYRTLVVTHGPERTLVISRALMIAAVVAGLGAAAVGVFPRAIWVTLPAWVWADRALALWSRLPAGGDARCASTWIGRLSVAVLGTILAVCVDHLVQLMRGAPPGGCGTAIVPEALLALCGGSDAQPF